MPIIPPRTRRPAFVIAFKAVIRNPKISADARLLLLIVKSYGNSDGAYCYPSKKRLAADMGCSERKVQRAVSELRKLSLITVIETTKRDGAKSSNTFVVDDERRAKLDVLKYVRRDVKRGDKSVQGGETAVSPTPPAKIVPFTEEKRALG